VRIGHSLVKRVRVRALKGRRNDDSFAAELARPPFRGAHERASNAGATPRFIDDEERDLRERRRVIHREPQMRRDQADDCVIGFRHEYAHILI
jgi:hypothetical protein